MACPLENDDPNRLLPPEPSHYIVVTHFGFSTTRPLHHPHPRHINTNVNSFRGTEKEENESFLYNARDGGRVRFDRLSVMVRLMVKRIDHTYWTFWTFLSPPSYHSPSHSPSHSSYSSSSCSSRQRKMALAVAKTLSVGSVLRRTSSSRLLVRSFGFVQEQEEEEERRRRNRVVVVQHLAQVRDEMTPSPSPSLHHRHTVTPSHRHTVTPSHRHTVTPSHRHTVTPSHRHNVTPDRGRTAGWRDRRVARAPGRGRKKIRPALPRPVGQGHGRRDQRARRHDQVPVGPRRRRAEGGRAPLRLLM